MKNEEVVKFVTENAKEITNKDGKVVLQVNKDKVNKFIMSRGITKAEIDKMAEVQSELLNGSIEAVQQQFVDTYSDADKVTLRMRTNFGYHDTSIVKARASINPKTKEKFIKYGMISCTVRLKSFVDKEIIQNCTKAIEKIA